MDYFDSDFPEGGELAYLSPAAPRERDDLNDPSRSRSSSPTCTCTKVSFDPACPMHTKELRKWSNGAPPPELSEIHPARRPFTALATCVCRRGVHNPSCEIHHKQEDMVHVLEEHPEPPQQWSRHPALREDYRLDDPFVENQAPENPLNPRIRHDGPTFINFDRRKSSGSRHPSELGSAHDKLETVVERGEMSPETIRPPQYESITDDTPALAHRLQEKVDPALDGTESPTKTQSHAGTSISSKGKVPRISSIANLKNHLFRSSRSEKDKTQSTKSGVSDLDDMMNDLSSLKAAARTESIRTGTNSGMLTESSGYMATGTDGSQETRMDTFGGDGAVPRRGSKNRKRGHRLADSSSKDWSQHTPERKNSGKVRRGMSPGKDIEPWKRAPVMVDFTTNAEVRVLLVCLFGVDADEN